MVRHRIDPETTIGEEDNSYIEYIICKFYHSSSRTKDLLLIKCLHY